MQMNQRLSLARGRLGNVSPLGSGLPWYYGLDEYMDFQAPDGNMVFSDTWSGGPVPDMSGVFTPIAANVLPRTNAGLLSQPARTNSIRNNSMVGASVGSPGTLPNQGWVIRDTNGINIFGAVSQGVSASVVAVGTAMGLPTLSIRIQGTPTATGYIRLSPDSAAHLAAATGAVVTNSVSAKIEPGAVGLSELALLCVERTNVAGFLAQQVSAIPADATLRRFERTFTVAQATATQVEPAIGIRMVNGTPIDVTITIAAPQMETGPYATSPIMTTTASATRTVNRQVIASDRIATGIAGFIKLDNLSVAGSTFEQVISFNNNSNNAIFIQQVSNTIRLWSTIAGSGQFTSINLGPWPVGRATIAFAFDTNFFKARVVGGADVAALTSGVVIPSGVNQIQIGAGSPGNYQFTKRLGFKYGAQNQNSFNAMYNLAQAA